FLLIWPSLPFLNAKQKQDPFYAAS
ncbi:flavin containing amine oxidoreductase family protein, partial [Chlamydia psittaci C1/97]